MKLHEIVEDAEFKEVEVRFERLVHGVRNGQTRLDAYAMRKVFGDTEVGEVRHEADVFDFSTLEWMKAPITFYTTVVREPGLWHHMLAMRRAVATDSVTGELCFQKIRKLFLELSTALPHMQDLRLNYLSLEMYDILKDENQSDMEEREYKVGFLGGALTGMNTPVWY
ncbi:hypothetical protein CYMTET_47756 [Cymbomonas tetramitiformis]|uniref:Uncharacterized protein n=1 Tax=Cymbomonas tetramitiformis TaxID=36881 RepID=A0AAE0BTR0_9CHLO|nr:hypothetical protein CYMTET_47756 [Cymbomonas tetramitiformis]|eukprot:gene368-694_t